ncbi:hypothetical protein WMF20_26700 [Sorangium sp. So ce834]|uniref:hypothetical protein n=1 Tax=Sorangium sp. So ce834 TaxID=3133321 RepID=UPI003F645CD0
MALDADRGRGMAPGAASGEVGRGGPPPPVPGIEGFAAHRWDQVKLPGRVEVRWLGGAARRIVLRFVPIAADRCRLEWMIARALPFGARASFRREEPAILRQGPRFGARLS